MMCNFDHLVKAVSARSLYRKFSIFFISMLCSLEVSQELGGCVHMCDREDGLSSTLWLEENQ